MIEVPYILFHSFQKGHREVKTLRKATHIKYIVRNGKDIEYKWEPVKKDKTQQVF